jgi:glycosyltransferase involved in cell wall biosynthesis
MRVLFISPSFYPALHYGGPIYINRDFCEALAKIEDVELEVLTTDADGPHKRIELNSVQTRLADNYTITYCQRMIRPDIAPGLLVRLPREIRRADIVHLNGVYSFSTIPTLVLCRLMRKPVLWSPLGALQRWRSTTRKETKQVWEHVCSLMCQSERVVLHVTSEEEKTESLEKIRNVEALVLRNGIQVPQSNSSKVFSSDGNLRLLYIGRLHPIKGVENLLRALALTKREVTLTVCGQGEGSYETQLRSLAISLGLGSRVKFEGRVAGALKERYFQDADLCVVPSFRESFGTVIVEALARGVPVIASRGTPWQQLETIGCGIFVSNQPRDLAEAIERAATMPLAAMGLRGRAWMERDFSWSGVVGEMIGAYQRLIQNGTEKRSKPMIVPV